MKVIYMRLQRPLKLAMKITQHTRYGLIPGAQKTGSGITSSEYAPDAETPSDDMKTKKGMHSASVAGKSSSRRR